MVFSKISRTEFGKFKDFQYSAVFANFYSDFSNPFGEILKNYRYHDVMLTIFLTIIKNLRKICWKTSTREVFRWFFSQFRTFEKVFSNLHHVVILFGIFSTTFGTFEIYSTQQFLSIFVLNSKTFEKSSNVMSRCQFFDQFSKIFEKSVGKLQNVTLSVNFWNN